MKAFVTDKGINNEKKILLRKVTLFLIIKRYRKKINKLFVDAVKGSNIPQFEDPLVNRLTPDVH